MRLEHGSQTQLTDDLKRIIGQYLDLTTHRIFFFGSRVSGKGDEHSDIDVGIEGQQPIPLEVMARIREDVTALPTLYKIDIVDFTGVAPEFRTVALEHIEII